MVHQYTVTCSSAWVVAAERLWRKPWEVTEVRMRTLELWV